MKLTSLFIIAAMVAAFKAVKNLVAQFEVEREQAMNAHVNSLWCDMQYGTLR